MSSKTDNNIDYSSLIIDYGLDDLDEPVRKVDPLRTAEAERWRDEAKRLMSRNYEEVKQRRSELTDFLGDSLVLNLDTTALYRLVDALIDASVAQAMGQVSAQNFYRIAGDIEGKGV